MKNFNIYDPMKKGEGLVLDGQTLAHLEILLNNEGTDEGSLLKLLGRCITPFGWFYFREKKLGIFAHLITQASVCSVSGYACLYANCLPSMIGECGLLLSNVD
jgi:hypothetical protein